MAEKKNRNLSTFILEKNVSYPFPSILGVLILFLIIASVSLLSLSFYGLGIYLPIGWNTTMISEQFDVSIRTMTIDACITSLLNSVYLTLLLVPLLVAFNFALGFSNGQIRTLLSFPIGRTKLILVKSGMIFILVATIVTSGGFFGLFLFYPYSIDLSLLSQLVITLWLTVFLMTSSCVLIAVLSRSAPVTIAGGIGVWGGAFVLFTSQQTSSFSASFLGSMLFPFFSTISVIYPNPPTPFQFMREAPINDVLLGCGAALVLGILLLYLSIILFRRVEA